jgi:hypothetical protein
MFILFVKSVEKIMRIYKIFEIFILSSEKIKLKKNAWNAFLFKTFLLSAFN